MNTWTSELVNGVWEVRCNGLTQLLAYTETIAHRTAKRMNFCEPYVVEEDAEVLPWH